VRRGFHHGDGGTVRLVNICGAGMALEMLLTGEPIDAARALQCNMVSRVVPHATLMDEAEKTAAAILRNDPWAIRSAKETILDVIGRPLDDQLAYEAMTGYSGAANPRVTELLEAFYDKTDEGRPGNDDPGNP
jgi:enoyl-CoA hydratase/carnithine racemase